MIPSLKESEKDFDNDVIKQYENIMRNHFFKKAAFGAASILSVTFGQAHADTQPASSRRETFTRIAIGGHKIYAKPETLKLGEGIFPHIVEVAQKDLVIIEPSRLDKKDIGAFINLPPIRQIYKPIGLLKVVKSPNNEWTKSFNENIIKSNEEAKKRYFESVYAKTAYYKAGENYSANKMMDLKTCLIMGDLDVSPLSFITNLGAIPPVLASEDFEKKFSDRKSILTMILLHEAAHCRQEKFVRSEGEEWESVTLKGELQADLTALVKYKTLLAGDENLDPDLPKNFSYIRMVAPFMLAQGNVLSSLTGLSHDHATGMGLLDTPTDEDIYSETSQTLLTAKALILRIADRADIDRLTPLAMTNVDATITQALENQKKFIRMPSRQIR